MRHSKYILHVLLGAALLAVPSCKVSPTTIALDFFSSSVSNPPGYWSPAATVIPANNTLNVPTDTSYVIIFSIPVDTTSADYPDVSVSIGGIDLTEGVDYNLSWNGDNTIETITFTAALPPSTGVTVTLTAGIVDAVNAAALSNPGSFLFTTGTDPDTTQPAIVGASNNPVSPPPVELTNALRLAAIPSQQILIDFNENIDPTSVNASTFFLDDGTDVIAATYTFVPATTRAILTPLVNLEANTVYLLTVTTGVRDLSGNALAAGTSWNFTTVADPYDPYGFLPVITEGPLVENVDDTSALISWITNKPTDYTLNYGRGDDTASSYVEPSFASLNVFEFAPVPIVLTANARYWFNVEYGDIVGNSGTSATLQFNTESDEVPDPVHNGAGSQHTAQRLAYTAGSPTGSFVFWAYQPGASQNLYGQLYDNAFTGLWNAGSPQALFNAATNYTFQSAVEDGTGGVIVKALQASDNRVYAKRFDGAGASSWGYAAGAAGFQVRAAAISSVSAVPVTIGTVQPVTTGTVEMGSLGLTNPFFDDDVDLSGLTDGDIIMDPVNRNGTTLDNNSAAQDFLYILGQDASIITAGDDYAIGSAADNEVITAQDHEIRNTNPDALVTDYVSGPTDLYTPHAYSLPGGWTMGAGDIVRRGAQYERVTGAPVLLTPIAGVNMIDFGIATGGTPDHLEDTGNAWQTDGIVSLGDFVLNSTKSLVSFITAIIDFDLTLDSTIDTLFDNTNDYEIYDRYCNDHAGDFDQFEDFYQIDIGSNIGITAGTAFTVYDYTGPAGTAQAIPGNPLLDNEGAFNAAAPPRPVVIGDVVINYTDDTFAGVASVGYAHAMGLASGIMADGEDYAVVRIPSGGTGDIVSVGTADFDQVDHLRDSSADFVTDGVVPGDRAYNLTDDTYALITAVAAADLTLDSDAFNDGNERYVILRSGLLFIFQEGTDVRGRITTMGGGGLPPVQITAAWTIYAGINPTAISDGSGNALLVYENNAAPRQIRAALLNGRGAEQWIVDIDTQAAVAESIVGVKSDGAGGVVVLYKYNTNLYAQRISVAGARLWGAGGIVLENIATVTSQETWEYITPNDVLVVANVGNNIWARRASFGATGWAAPITYTALGSTQEAPELFLNGADTIILWQDNRFLNPPSVNTGWGVFGLKIDAADGAIDPAWYANTTGVNDLNGVSIILNSYNYLRPYPLVVPYNNGADARLIWEDYRAGTANDLLSIDLVSFTPP